MAVKARYKGSGGLRWRGPSGTDYQLLSSSFVLIKDDKDVAELVRLGDCDFENTQVQVDEVVEEKPKRGRRKKEEA